MKDTMPPPSSDTLWDWAAYVLVAGWVAAVEAGRRALRRGRDERKAMADRITALEARDATHQREIESHLIDCKTYREMIAGLEREKARRQEAEERRQEDRHKENTARLTSIEKLLIARALGVSEP